MTERPTRSPTLPVPLLRDAVAREVVRTSLRRVGAAIGLSPNALRNFLAGARPRAATRAKIERWFSVQRQGRGPNLASFIRLLGDVTADLSPNETESLAQDVATFLVHAYERRRLPPPRWVRDLAEHYHPSRRR